MAEPMPLSLRRKVMLIFDQDLLTPGHVELEGERDELYEGRLKDAYKMAAWAVANIVRKDTDHVFLGCCVKQDKYFDPAVVSEIITNVLYNEENKVDNRKIIEAVLEKISKTLAEHGVSVSIDVPSDMTTTESDLATDHKVAIVVAQPNELSTLGKAVSMDWAERMVRDGSIPVVIVKGNVVPDSILSNFKV